VMMRSRLKLLISLMLPISDSLLVVVACDLRQQSARDSPRHCDFRIRVLHYPFDCVAALADDAPDQVVVRQDLQ